MSEQSAVNHPVHYNQGEMEVIEAIEGLQLGFHEGNVLKYVARHPWKGSSLRDLEKASWYLLRLIAREKKYQGVVLTEEEEEVLGVNKVPHGFN